MQSETKSYLPFKRLDPHAGYATTSGNKEEKGLFSSSFILSLRSSLRGSSLPRLPPEPLGLFSYSQ